METKQGSTGMYSQQLGFEGRGRDQEFGHLLLRCEFKLDQTTGDPAAPAERRLKLVKGQNQREDIGRERKTKILSSHIQNLEFKHVEHTYTHTYTL